MAISPGYWWKRTVEIYHDNATARRDFRSQLRGNKSMLVWGGYLGILMGATSLAYYAVAQSGWMTLANMQMQLKAFYGVLVFMLGALISLVLPALAAGAIVTERQRRSLDLIMCAPVEPKKLLVGKMLSSYRYTWMLLVLSLPLAAVCAVLGGATWADVLSSYLILSFSGLVLTAIALLISSLTSSIAAAVLWTYLAVGVYLGGTSLLAVTGLSTNGSAVSSTLGFLTPFNPFVSSFVGASATAIWGIAVPNWVFGGIGALFISKVLLLGAASSLKTGKSVETISLRVHGLGLALGIALLGSWAFTLYGGSNWPSFNADVDAGLGMGICLLTLALLLVIPHAVCYGKEAPNKYANDGRFDFRQMLTGAPSGGLPYLLAILAAATTGSWLGRGIAITSLGNAFLAPYRSLTVSPFLPSTTFWSGVLWSAGFLAMCWGFGRFVSSRASTLRNARIGLVALLIGVFGLPMPILALIASTSGFENSSSVFRAQLLYPLAGPGIAYGAGYAALMALLGWAALRLERSGRAALAGT